jgi:hypothetical protein
MNKFILELIFIYQLPHPNISAFHLRNWHSRISASYLQGPRFKSWPRPAIRIEIH